MHLQLILKERTKKYEGIISEILKVEMISKIILFSPKLD